MTFNTELWNGAAPLGPTEPRSLRFNSGDSAHLSRTPTSAGNRKRWSWAGWVKRSKLGSSQPIFSGVQDGNNATVLSFNSSDYIEFYNYTSGYSGRMITSAQYRDPSAWYHIVLIWYSDNGTADVQIRLYVNGIRVTNFGTSSNPSSANSIVNSTNGHYIGADVGFNNQYSNQYLADVHFIDGSALDPTSFGEFDATTGVWNPIEFTGTHNPNYTSSYSAFFSYSNVDAGTVDDAFDGSTSTEFEFNSSGGNGVFAPPGGIPYTTSVEVYTARTITMNVSLNGGANVTYGGGWTTIASGSGTLNTLTFSNGNAGNQRFGAIRVDGTILTSGTVTGTNGVQLRCSDNSGR